MKICPTCNAHVTVLIVSVQNGQHFCHHCSGQVCPTFMAHYVLTLEDVLFLKACGVDPEITKIEEVMEEIRRIGDPNAEE